MAMKVIALQDDGLPTALRGGVAALGNFDGVHPGHRAVIGSTLAWARAQQSPALIVTFAPHPVRLFKPDIPPFALTSADQRLRLFAQMGVDATIIIPFTPALAAVEADDFTRIWLKDRLGLSGLIVGEDFMFGRGRRGSARQLVAQGPSLGFETRLAPVLRDANRQVVSSTRIRDLLRNGRCREAAQALGRAFTIEGPVEKGEQRGRTIGFPTANIALGDMLRPALGVYCISAHLDDGRTVMGVANIGRRPTVCATADHVLLEAHLFDWDEAIYGRTLAVSLEHYLRDEQKFANIAALRTQIAQDVQEARTWFSTNTPSPG